MLNKFTISVFGVVALLSAPAVLAQANLTAETASPGSCLLYTSPSPRDVEESRMPSSA